MGEEALLRAAPGWSPEVRIANPPPALLAKYTAKEKTFFTDYANFVFAITSDSAVTHKLNQIFATEHISFERPIDIRVMVFPARPLRGRSNRILHGSFSRSASQISLYPLKVPKDWIRQDGAELFGQPYPSLSMRKQRFVHEVAENAIATLIHEVLHAKLERREMRAYVEESLVRKLETLYMEGWDEIISGAVRRAFK